MVAVSYLAASSNRELTHRYSADICVKHVFRPRFESIEAKYGARAASYGLNVNSYEMGQHDLLLRPQDSISVTS